jgi:ABC-type nitrate/sulfonate/bicarbonate transport system ATPase subunit
MLRSTGTTALLVTHDVDEAAAIADRTHTLAP